MSNHETYTEEQIARVQRLRPIDDVLFEVLADDKAFCQEMLQTILEDKQLQVTDVIVQSSQRNIYGRSVRLDALCILGNGEKCNIEVQRADRDDHFKRVRYNASVITSRCTKPGAGYEKIPTVIVVYISEHDFLKGGRTIYHLEQVVRETGSVIRDGYSAVFVNTEVDDGTDIAELMRCMIQDKVQSPKFPAFSRRMEYVKDVKGGLGAVCKVMEEYAIEYAKGEREKALEQGRKQGRKQGRREGISHAVQKLMKAQGLTKEEAEKILL